MTRVFIGGSRAIHRLNPLIRERLDDLMQRECLILIGDANGSDKMVQQYCAEQGYRNIVVYCMGVARNNVGNWPVKRIESQGRVKDFAYYAAKDSAMAGDAKCGVMFWDGASKGTLHNIQNLISAGKKVLVYLSASQSFVKLSSQSDLDHLLQSCDPGEIAEAQKQITRKLSSNTQLLLTPER